MERVDESLRFNTAVLSQRDDGILGTIRYGLMIKNLRKEISEEEQDLAVRIGEALDNADIEMLDMSTDEAALAVNAIETNNEQEKRLEGVVATSQGISAQGALQEIRAFAESAKVSG